MTRFFVKTSKEDTLREMDKAIEQLGFTFKKNSPQMVRLDINVFKGNISSVTIFKDTELEFS